MKSDEALKEIRRLYCESGDRNSTLNQRDAVKNVNRLLLQIGLILELED